MKTGKIILKHTLTIFNLVNLILAILVASVGSYKNMLFVFIALANTLISIINDLRAKKIIDQMRLIAEQKPTIIRDGKTFQIPPEKVQKGDLVVLALGDQVLFDAKIEEGTVEVNESFVTGESDNIAKHPGDDLISGSFVVSGTCKAKVEKIGSENSLNKIETAAKTIKTADSKLFTLMNNIVKYISYTLIPIGALLLWARFRVADSPEAAITGTVAALINMIPEGLVLLTSSVLALATIRLSKQKVLVQDLYSIETLARVDCICLDKTGTLTTGHMKVKDLIPADNVPKNALLNALELILAYSDSDNATSLALKKAFLKTPKNRPKAQNYEVIPFSSDRKYSGLRINNKEYLLGAPEFLSQATLDSDDRVLAVVEREKDGYSRVLGYVILEDELRKNARELVDYFYSANVQLKIISGDSVKTVTKIAEKSGLKSLRAVDLSSVKDRDYAELAKNYDIFARVKPDQKKSLIKALRKQGKTVAMTGDGVNDILAMKEADVSLAIGEGSDAARRSAKLVLLNNDFTSVPAIIDEGRQSINNLERSATLFLSKTVYAAILAVLFVFLPLPYPFSPIEMSLLNFLCIGLPGLALALEKNTDRVKDRFLENVKHYSVPTGILIAIATVILSIVASVTNLSRPELTLISSLVVLTIDCLLIYQVSKPLNLFRASLLLLILAIFAVALLLPLARTFIFFP